MYQNIKSNVFEATLKTLNMCTCDSSPQAYLKVVLYWTRSKASLLAAIQID